MIIISYYKKTLIRKYTQNYLKWKLQMKIMFMWKL